LPVGERERREDRLRGKKGSADTSGPGTAKCVGKHGAGRGKRLERVGGLRWS